MGHDHQFTLKQIVWAKVSEYPWWPARIVKTLTQRCRNIYKVHFFGDLSYCYLQSQQLLDFESGFARLQEKHSTDLILKKSIQLAKTAFQKSKTKTCASENQNQYFQEVQPTIVDSFQETKLESKHMIQTMEKCELNLQLNSGDKIQKQEIYQQMSQITTENVIEFISSPSFQELKKSKGYNNRKQLLTLQLKFKEVLLAKYNLSQIHKTHPLQKKPTNHFHGRIHRRKLIEKQNKKRSFKNKDVLISSARKLEKILKRTLGYTTQEAQAHVEQHFKNIHYGDSKNRKQFARNFVHYIKYIIKNKRVPDHADHLSQNRQQLLKIKDENYMSIEQLTNKYNEDDYSQRMENLNASTMELEDELKREDEERSKVTQIEGYSFSYTH